MTASKGVIAAVQARFADATFVEDGWDHALRALADATRSSRAQLLSLSERHLRLNWITDEPDGYAEDFVAIGAYRPDVNWRIAASGKPFEIVHEAHYDLVKQRGEDAAYRHHIERFGGEHGCQTALLDEHNAFFGLATLRTAGDGRCVEDDLAVFGAIAPHVLAAIRRQHALEHQGAVLMKGALDAMGSAVFLLDEAGNVCAHSGSAETLLEKRAIRLRDRRLSAHDRHDDARLQTAIARALTGDVSTHWQDLWIAGADMGQGGDRMLCEAFAMPRQPWGLGFYPAAMVVLRAPRRASISDAERIAVALSLSPAEGAIAAMLSAGASRTTIAATRGTSPQTLTSQLKTIFRKVGVSREAELIANVLAILP